MSKISLFVDDARRAPSGWKVARTVTQAIQFLAEEEIEEISLDHHIDGSYECFCPVAYFLAEKYSGKENPPAITIHTSDPQAAEKMQGILSNRGLNSRIL